MLEGCQQRIPGLPSEECPMLDKKEMKKYQNTERRAFE